MKHVTLAAIFALASCGQKFAGFYDSTVGHPGRDEDIAGIEVGNGGGGVVCRDDQGDVTSVEVIDYWVARQEWFLTIDLGPGAYMAKVFAAIQRLENFDPERALAYKDEADHFNENAAWLDNVTLPDPNDTDDIAQPAGKCRFETVALQRKTQVPGDRYFRVNNQLFLKMDETNKAGLILHEIIYKEALSLGHKNSRKSRYFNAVVSSTDFAKQTRYTYYELLDHLMLLRPGQVVYEWNDEWKHLTWQLIQPEPVTDYMYSCSSMMKMFPTERNLVEAYPRMGDRLAADQMISHAAPWRIFVQNSQGNFEYAMIYPDHYELSSYHDERLPVQLFCL